MGIKHVKRQCDKYEVDLNTLRNENIDCPLEFHMEIINFSCLNICCLCQVYLEVLFAVIFEYIDPHLMQ